MTKSPEKAQFYKEAKEFYTKLSSSSAVASRMGFLGESERRTLKKSVLHRAFEGVYFGILRVRMWKRNG